MDDVRLAQDVLSEVLGGRIPEWSIITLLATRMIGYCIMAGAAITKVPQIVAVIKNKSAEGLSLISFELELLGTVLHMSYGYAHKLPISAYGEAIVMFIQSVVLNTAIYNYAKTPSIRPTIIFLGLGYGLAFVIRGKIPMDQIDQTFEFNQVFFATARASQIWKNFRQGHAGQLSVITYALFTVGGFVRILTSIRENAGETMIRACIMGFALNGALMLQILYYMKVKWLEAKRGKKDDDEGKADKEGDGKKEEKEEKGEQRGKSDKKGKKGKKGKSD